MQLYFCQSHLADVTVYNSCTGVTVKALLLDVPGILLDITKSVSPERSQKTSSNRQFWETLNQIQGNTNEIRTQIGVDRVGHASSRINDECEVKPNVDGYIMSGHYIKFIDFIADGAKCNNMWKWCFCVYCICTIQKFLKVFESLFCSPRLHLFDQKYSKTVILWNIITI